MSGHRSLFSNDTGATRPVVHAAHVVEVAKAFVVFNATHALAGFVAEFASGALPVVVVQVVGQQELLDEVGGQMRPRFPRVCLLPVAFPTDPEPAQS